MTDEELITVLSTNVSQLIDVCNAQRQANNKLGAVLKAQQVANQKLQTKIDSLEAQLNSTSIAEALLETNSTPKIARARVNNLIKQIDKCISMLNR